MYIPKKLTVSAFLMLVLIQSALSVPAGNNKNNNKLSEKKGVDPFESFKELTEKLRNLVQHEVNEAKAKFEDLVGHITSPETNKKIKDLLAELSKENPAEAAKKLIEEINKMAANELAGAKAKLDELVNHINSSETHKKIKELLSELSDGKLAESYKKLTERLKKVAERDLAVVKAKYEDFIAHINTPEANQKLKDLMAELTPEKLEETYKKLTERMTNVVKQELAGVKAKIDELVKHITSAETQKKLKDLLGELSEEKLEAIYNKVAIGMTKVVQQEVAAIKAKIEDLLAHIKPANGKNL